MNLLRVASTRVTLETATKPHLFVFWRVILPLVSIIVPSPSTSRG